MCFARNVTVLYLSTPFLFVCLFFACHFSPRKFSGGQPFGKNLLLWPPQYFTPSDAPASDYICCLLHAYVTCKIIPEQSHSCPVFHYFCTFKPITNQQQEKLLHHELNIALYTIRHFTSTLVVTLHKLNAYSVFAPWHIFALHVLNMAPRPCHQLKTKDIDLRSSPKYCIVCTFIIIHVYMHRAKYNVQNLGNMGYTSDGYDMSPLYWGNLRRIIIASCI